jgi:hypothetical protein
MSHVEHESHIYTVQIKTHTHMKSGRNNTMSDFFLWVDLLLNFIS